MITTEISVDEPEVMSDIANPNGELLEGPILKAQLAKHPGVDWSAAIWIGIIHIGALAAPLTFTRAGLVAMLVCIS